MERITGNCLCGSVAFEVDDAFENFQLCHCTQCQKTTGSAHASSLFTAPESITWLSGEENIVRYDLDDRSISNAFCKQCGSRVPYLSRSGKVLVVVAGSLNSKPSISPRGNIFWEERAGWYDEAVAAEHYPHYIE
jgi:hypothetical protein